MPRLLRALLVAPLLVSACASSDGAATSNAALTSLPEAAVAADLDFLGEQVRQLYAPLAAKQAAGFDLDAELTKAHGAIHAATDDGGRIGAIHAFVASLHDSGFLLTDATFHGENATDSTLPLAFRAAEGKYVTVSASAPSTIGDVLVAIDGVPIADLATSLAPLVNAGLPDVQTASIATMLVRRSFWVPASLRPTGSKAHVDLLHADGTPVAIDVLWSHGTTLDEAVALALLPDDPADTAGTAPTPATTPEPAPTPAPAYDPVALGTPRPEWWTFAVANALHPDVVAPSKAALDAIGPTLAGFQDATDNAPHALRFMEAGKAIVVVRIPNLRLQGDDAASAVDWVGTLLREQKPDAVVLDVTSQSGGFQAYLAGLASLFLTAPIPNTLFAYHADRQNLATLASATQHGATPAAKTFYGNLALDLERAFDASQPLGPFTPLVGLSSGTGITVSDAAIYGAKTIAPNPRATYTGPVLVLANERTSGVPEALALALQSAGVAKTFGTTTAGAGSITGYVELPATQTHLWIPRSLLAVGTTQLQDRGVTPDFPHLRTLADVRTSYLGFVTSFLQTASSFPR